MLTGVESWLQHVAGKTGFLHNMPGLGHMQVQGIVLLQSRMREQAAMSFGAGAS